MSAVEATNGSSGSNGVANGVLWRVNQEEFTRRFRADAIATYAAVRHGDAAGAVVAAMLRRADASSVSSSSSSFRVGAVNMC